MSREVVFIGMDLGTFKTSVVCSNGRRGVIQTAVGYPKDHIARAMLGRDVVFGAELAEQRLALNIVRPFEKGALKYLEADAAGVAPQDIEAHKEAARQVVRHAVSLTAPPAGAPIFGVIGAPSRATILNKQTIIEAAADTFAAVAIVPEPFSVAYGMERLTDTLVIDIGAGTIDLCPMTGTLPTEEDQVTLPLGGDAVDECFLRLLAETYPEARVSRNMAREIKEKYGFVHDLEERVEVLLPTAAQPRRFDITAPLKEACRSLVDPIVGALRSMLAHFDPEFQQRLLNNILLGGGGSQLKGLDRLIEESLREYGGGSVTRVYDSVFAGAVGALKLAMSMPPNYWQQLRTAPAAVEEAATASEAA